MIPIIQPKQPKKFYFSKQELEYLLPRWELYQEHWKLAEGIEMVIGTYVLRNVLIRLGITEPRKYLIDYDIVQGFITLLEKPEPPKPAEEAKIDGQPKSEPTTIPAGDDRPASGGNQEKPAANTAGEPKS